MNISTDRIERTILLKAPLARVWDALADAKRFGEWFRIDFKGSRFVAGESLEGAVLQPGLEHVSVRLLIEAIEPKRRMVFRWHPSAIDAGVDYSAEPMTKVSFDLEETRDGVRLQLVESGFDALPEARRAEAWRMNGGGWDQQMENIARYVQD